MSAQIIAELSGNHLGDIGRAKALIHAAKDAGAHAVKLQTYTPSTMTLQSDAEPFRIKAGPWAGKTLWDLYSESATPWEWHEALFAEAKKVGIECFSTPFDETAVEFLEMLDCPKYKVASFELTHLPLIERIAKTEKPILLSTGMATDDEIKRAWRKARACGSSVTIMHCISEYPAGPQMDMYRMKYLRLTPKTKIGLSDHTLDHIAGIVAVTLGASVLEKHLCLSRKDGGPDSGFSLEPAEFKAYVQAVHQAQVAMHDSPPPTHRGLRRSVWITKPVKRGDLVTKENTAILRPEGGIEPRHLGMLLGFKYKDAYAAGSPLTIDKLFKGRKRGRRPQTPSAFETLQIDD